MRQDLECIVSQGCSAPLSQGWKAVVRTAFGLAVWLAAAAPVLAQAIPTTQVPSPALPTVNTDQLFQPIPPAPAIPVVPIPEVTNVVTPQVPTAIFPEFNFGAQPVNPPTLTSPPFSGPQLTAPQFAAPALAGPALAAPNFAAPAFVGFQSTAPQLTGPTFNRPAFSAPNLAAPTFAAPTLNFVSAPEANNTIQSPTLPDVTLPVPSSPFGN